MENVVTEESIKRAIIMALANIEMEEDFKITKEQDFLVAPQKLKEKIKKKVLGNERHLG